MKVNTVKAKLKAGQASVGTWLTLAAPLAAEFMAHVGHDWLVVDTEHSPADYMTTMQCFQAICTTDTIPMARVAWNDPVLIKRLLDAGALGLVVPMVNSAEDADQAVKSMKFPPDGFRSMSRGRGGHAYGDDYMERANDEILVVVQIEHADAVKRVKDILSVPGVDACFIGPSDLGATMGVERGSPEHEAAIQTVLAAAKETGVAPGIHCGMADDVNRRLEQGFRFIAHLSECGFMLALAKEDFGRIRTRENP